MQAIAATISQVASFQCSALITGETGSGKEVVARRIHATGPRAEGVFVAVNCGALVTSLAESQLFGHERGAFTGAHTGSLGAVRAADGGVLFLDEIGEMPPELQPLLLRVLQEREVTPVGGTRPESVDVQVLAATNRDLENEVKAGRFREDLLYRLNTVLIDVPPLRERPEDIPALVEHFSRQVATRMNRPVWQPDATTLARFRSRDWPGNLRELAQAVERMYVLGTCGVAPARARPADTPAPASPAAADPDPVLPLLDLIELRRLAVRQALAATNGHRGKAAVLLNVSPNTMTKLIADACPEHKSPRGRRPR
jgi:DNA-binding NtrC family response regulator